LSQAVKVRSCKRSIPIGNIVLAILCALPFATSITFAAVENAAEYYKGRTVAVVVGSSTGGGYDLNARVLAQYMGKHIPGNPSFIVQNMPGAGGLKLAGYMYHVAPGDGLSIAILQRNLTVEPLFTTQLYDGSKFSWIGSISKDVSLCISSSKSSIKTFMDLKGKPFIVAGQGAGSDSYVFAAILKNFFGVDVKIISGYPGTSEMGLAMERGEVDGMCGISYSTLKSRFPKWLSEKSINILVQASMEREPALADVPSMAELAASDADRAALKLLVGTQRMARPFMAPPDIPQYLKTALRKAFDQTMQDAEFGATASKLDVDISPMTGDEVERLVRELYDSPKEIALRAAKAIVAP
jgi:tripartite-type tricarboxylate transporter receptor subunit TctC